MKASFLQKCVHRTHAASWKKKTLPCGANLLLNAGLVDVIRFTKGFKVASK
jgi:hypothetical protein